MTYDPKRVEQLIKYHHEVRENYNEDLTAAKDKYKLAMEQSSAELKTVAPVKPGDYVEIIDLRKYYGKKALVSDTGFFNSEDLGYEYKRSVLTFVPGVRLIILRKDNTQSTREHVCGFDDIKKITNVK